MKIAVLGTGMVGQALAGRLAELGHQVRIGTRDSAATIGAHRARRHGQPAPTAAGAAAAPGRHAGHPSPQATAAAQLIVNATSGDAALAALEAAGAAKPRRQDPDRHRESARLLQRHAADA